MKKVIKALLAGVLAIVIGLLIMVIIPSFTIEHVFGTSIGTAVCSSGGDATSGYTLDDVKKYALC